MIPVDKLKANGDIRGLIEALGQNAVWPDRGLAAQNALVQIGAPAIEALIVALGDENVCALAAGTLRKIGAPAVEALIVALGDENRHVRALAADALGTIGDARAVEPLIVALEDQNEAVRQCGAKALGAFGDARAVEPLIVVLGDADKDVRALAAHALGKIGDARAVEPLIVVLGDEHKDVRALAARALGKIGDARAVEPLITVLKDQNEAVRQEAANALDRLGWSPDSGAAGAGYRAVRKAGRVARPSIFGWLASVVLAALVGTAAVALGMLILAGGLHVGGGGLAYVLLFLVVSGASYRYSAKLMAKFVWLPWPVLAAFVAGVVYLIQALRR